MNWTPEAVRAEMNYRVERALREAEINEARTYAHPVRHGPHLWWRRLRAQHRTPARGEQNAA